MRLEIESESKIRLLQDNYNRAQETLRNITEEDEDILALATQDLEGMGQHESEFRFGSGINRSYRVALAKIRQESGRRAAHADVVITNMKEKIKQLEEMNDDLSQKLKAAERSLSLVPQPVSYLVERIADLERVCASNTRDMNHYVEKYNQLTTKLESSENECATLRTQLSQVLEQRQELEKFRNMLEEIYEQSSESEDDADSDNGEINMNNISNGNIAHNASNLNTSEYYGQDSFVSEVENMNQCHITYSQEAKDITSTPTKKSTENSKLGLSPAAIKAMTERSGEKSHVLRINENENKVYASNSSTPTSPPKWHIHRDEK
jgi:uncharacterized phage infection (PIP) family protein YhgE